MKKLITYVCLTLISIIGYSRSGSEVSQSGRTLALKKGFHRSQLFVENVGQIRDQQNRKRSDIDYVVAAANGLTIFIAPGAIHYQFCKVGSNNKENLLNSGEEKDQNTSIEYQMYRMDVELTGCNKNAAPIAENMQVYKEIYYNGGNVDGVTGARSFKKLIYKNIYPNVDWVLYMRNGSLKHEFIVKPGGKASDIRISYRGASQLKITNTGSLMATTPFGAIEEEKPRSFTNDGREVASSFVLDNNTLYYRVDKYEGELTIDPVLGWSTYFGGPDMDQGRGLTTDHSGNVYICGFTESTSSVATTGAFLTSYAGAIDAFLTKFNSAGDVEWSTYYGGNSTEYPTALATDDTGNVYMTGYSSSTTGLSTPGTHQSGLGGGGWYDAFIAKFNSSGIRVWGTYFGGPSVDQGVDIAVNKKGEAHICGYTASSSGVVSAGAQQTTHGGSDDAFLAKFSVTGTRVWATYMGGSTVDRGHGVALDSIGNVYMTGRAASTTNISTSGAHQITRGGGDDAFIAKYDSAGIRQWGTYYGGSNTDYGYGVGIDDSGNVYAGGITLSATNIGTPSAFKPTIGASSTAAFLVKLDNSGVRQWGTYYGDNSTSQISKVVVDTANNILITGYSQSTAGIATAGAYQTVLNGTSDAFLSKFSPSCALLWGTYFGGPSGEQGYAIGTAAGNKVYFAGATGSASGIATPGSYQELLSGTNDAFLTYFDDCSSPVAGSITGLSTVNVGGALSLSSSVAGGTWTSSNIAVAIVDASTGVVTGIAAGSDTIIYSITNACGTATASYTISVAESGTRCYMPTSDLLVWMPFTGNVADSSGNGYEGINIGATLTTDRFGNANSAYYFDGSGNYIDIPYSTAFNTEKATWNIWYKLDQPNDNGITGRFIWGSDFGGGEHITNMILSDVPEIQIAAGSAYNLANTGETVTDDNWHMLTTIYDQAAGQMKIYQDGIYKSSAPVSPFTWSGGAIRFGLSTDPYWQKYLGALDDAALYTRVLTDEEIMRLYTGTFAEPVISGGTALCVGGTITLSSSVAGGSWSSSDDAVSTIDETTGVVTGVSGGVATISYIVTNSCGADTATQLVTVVPDLASAVTISPATIDVCPGETTTVSIDGPAGTIVTYMYELQDLAGTSATGIFDSVRTITLDGSGHGAIPVATTDEHSGETSELSYNFTRYYHTLMSASLGSCSTSFTPDNSAMVSANYVAAYWQNLSARAFRFDASNYWHVCSGAVDTFRLNTPGDAVVVVKFTNLHTMALSYDTITMPHTGMFDFYTDPVTDSVSYTVVAINSAGCDKILMDDYSIKIREMPHSSMTMKAITGSAYPDDYDDVYPEGPYAPTCTGTYRNLKVEFAGTAIVPAMYTPMPPFVTYTINGGAPQNTYIGLYSPDAAIINTGIITADQHYHFISVTDDAGCVSPISDSFFIPILEYPTASLSAPTSICGGDSASVTITGTPSQVFLLYQNGVETVNNMGPTGVYTISTGAFDTTTQIVLGLGYYEHEGNCLTHYDDTASVVVSYAPSGTSITSEASICTGGSITLTASVSGGSWTVSGGHTSLSGGVLTGVSAGTDMLTYIVSNSCGADTAVQLVTVTTSAFAGTVSGADSICQGATTAFISSGDAGGTWSSDNTAIATVSSSGSVYGVSGGMATISYTVTTPGCGTATATRNILVRALPSPVSISGADTVCVGASTVISSTSTEGYWDIGLPSVATIDAGGNLTGVSPGTTPLIYRADVVGCGMAADTMFITVVALPNAGVVSGADSICQGASTTFTSSGMAGGVWSSANTAIATVDASGHVFGAGGGVTTITYTVSQACGTATATHNIRVKALPLPVSISGADTICVGSTTVISSTSTEGHWDIGLPSVATIDAGGNLTGVSPGTTPLIYRTDVTGCFMAADTMFITVRALPDAGAVSGATSVCAGSSTTLITTGVSGVWSSSNNLIATVSAGGVVTGVTAGTVTVSYIATTSGCGSDTATHSITVDPAADAGTISGSDSVCQGAVITLSNAVAGTWSSSDALVATVDAGGAVTGVAAGVVTITFTSVATVCGTATTTHNVTVNALPAVAPITGTTGLCAGTATTLSDITVGGIWATDNAAVASVDAMGNVATGIAGTANITYTVTNIHGCSAAETIVVTVNALPVLSPISGPLVLSVGALATYSDTAMGGTWSSSNVTIATIDVGTGMAGGVAEGLVTLTYTATNAAGCTSFVTLDIAVADTMGAITISPTGTVVLCHGAPVSLGAIVPGSPAGLSYQWYVDGVAVPGANDSVYMATVPGDVSVVVSSATSTYTVTGVTVVAGPSATVGLTGTNTLFTGSFSTYQWYYNGVAITGANASIYNATATGNYFVVVADGSGCTDTSNVFYFSTVGVQGTSVGAIMVSLYPNPATSVLHIDAPVTVDVKVTTADGRTLISAANATTIDMSQLAAGMYMVMVYDKEGALLKSEKLIKAD